MRILIAEDERISRELLRRALENIRHEVIAVTDGLEAWNHIVDESADIRLVIADWMMPGLDGIELTRRIRSAGFRHYVYVIMLTSRGQRQDVIDGLSAGADDYVIKPFDPGELFFRVRCGLRIVDLEEQLAARNRELERMAMVDGLTAIPNRRAFDDDLGRRILECQRYRRPFALLMIDIDQFKNYNDTLGHAAGDSALRRIALVLKRALRGTDDVYRYGGEEFACILPETDEDGAMLVAERLRAAVEAEKIPHPGTAPGVVTVSVGVTVHRPQHPDSPSWIVENADRALYRAKRAGRNRISGPQQATCTGGFPVLK
ncbi:MAG: diguanylate cyclase [Acidobacteriota bacterium]|nr:MAG: diguanylate cyclase [Acidobacteriota bacterium]